MIPSKHQFDGQGVKLGDVATYINGYAFKPADYSLNGKQIIRIQDLTGNAYQTNNFAGELDDKYLVSSGDVLISWSASLGVFEWNKEEAWLNQHIFKVVFNKLPVDKRYFIHQARYVINRGAMLAHGATMRHLTKKVFESLPFSSPNRSEQLTIAKRFDDIQGEIDLAEKQISKLDSLVKSRFVEMFGDFKTNVKCWPVANFDSFAFIDTHMTKDFDKYADEPHIGIDSIEAKTGRLVGYRTVAEDKLVSGKYPFTAKHIIYSKIRPNLNKVALPDFSGLCSADAYPIKPIEGKSNRVFLAHVMRSDYFLDYILPLSGRAQMPKVNKDAIRGFSMPLPPIDLQNTFAAFAAQVDKSRFAGTFTGTINVKNYAISCSVHNNSGRIPNEALHSAREVTEYALLELQELYDSLTQKYFAL